MAKKTAVRKQSAKKAKPKAGGKKAAAPARKAGKAAPVKRVAAKPASKPSGKPAAKPAAKTVTRTPAPGESLGRPLVTAEEKLYMLFKEDYHARQIFEFLRVNTVGELEQYSPQQIIQILSSPVRKTVERIRQRLAENKRSLRDDAGFAREHLSTHPPG